MHARSGPLTRFPRERPRLSLLLAVLAVELVGASGSIFTAQGLQSWYGTLTRPGFAPPNWVFAPVWTTLFALMGVALWLVWRQADTSPGAVRLAIAVFAVHFLVCRVSIGNTPGPLPLSFHFPECRFRSRRNYQTFVFCERIYHSPHQYTTGVIVLRSFPGSGNDSCAFPVNCRFYHGNNERVPSDSVPLGNY